MSKLILSLVSAGLLILNSTSYADKASQATIHFKSIAAGDISKLIGQYEKNARLDWIGGPLDGSYSGTGELRSVWNKFTKALGPMTAEIKNVKENSNPKGATITADVVFSGKKSIPVRYVLVYRDNRIVSEVWQISPALKNSY